MVGDAEERDHARLRADTSEEPIDRQLNFAPAERQDAAMQVEAGDPVHDRLARHVDRNLRRQEGEEIGQRRNPLLGEEQRYDPVPCAPDGDVEDDLALGDEQPFAPDQVPFPHVAVGRDALVRRVVDRDQPHHGGLSRPPARRAPHRADRRASGC